MFKLLLTIVVVYFLFKIIKNAAIVAIENKLRPKTLKEPEELVKCSTCARFISPDLSIKKKNKHFCSNECLNSTQDK